MRNALPLLAALALAAACGQAPQANSEADAAAPAENAPIAIDDAVVTLPAIPGRPGAGYFTLRTTLESVRLTGIASPLVERIELHETTLVDGVSRMGPLTDADATPAAPLVFESGGRHAMLFGIDAAVAAGGTLPLTFTFEGADPVTVEAEVRGPGQGGHAGH